MLDKANLKDQQEKRIALANKYAQRSKIWLNLPVSFKHVTIQNSEKTNKTTSVQSNRACSEYPAILN